MSINTVRRSIELFTYLIQENYFHSSNFVKNWLTTTIRLIVREGLDFIRMHCVRKINIYQIYLSFFNHIDQTTNDLY
jgi:hypothetical protein